MNVFILQGYSKSQGDESDVDTLYSSKRVPSPQIPTPHSLSTENQSDVVDMLNLNPMEQKKLLNLKLFPLVKTFKPFLAKSITDYLVNNAESSELTQVLNNPKLLLPHYIAVALSSMNLAATEI